MEPGGYGGFLELLENTKKGLYVLTLHPMEIERCPDLPVATPKRSRKLGKNWADF